MTQDRLCLWVLLDHRKASVSRVIQGFVKPANPREQGYVIHAKTIPQLRNNCNPITVIYYLRSVSRCSSSRLTVSTSFSSVYQRIVFSMPCSSDTEGFHPNFRIFDASAMRL